MEQDESIERVRDDHDDRIVGHKKGIGVESLAAIILKQLEIAQKVNDQKQHKQNPRQRHDDLLADGRGKEFREPTHSLYL